MKIELNDLSPVKKKIRVEVGADVVERETDEVLRGYRKKVRVPGFRPGKAPLSIIRGRFAEEVKADVRDRLVSRLFEEATKDRGLKPLGEPSLEQLAHEEGQPLSFESTFEVLPRIEVKSAEDVEVRRPSAELADEEVDRALDELRQAHVKLVAEEGRSATRGDVVVADVEGTPPDGPPFHRERMTIEVGAANNLPAFDEALEGAAAGAELEFPVEYPQDYGSKDLAGKTVPFKLRVHEVKRRELPELDDEFAKDLGEFDDLAALRARVCEDLQARKKHEADQAVKQAVLDKLLLQNPVVLPDVLVENEIRRRLEDVVRGMILRGMDPNKAEIDWKELRKHQEEPARKSVHARLILDAVAEAERIEVEPQAVEERIRQEAGRIGEDPQKFRARLREQSGIETLTGQLVREKTLDYLTSVANIE